MKKLFLFTAAIICVALNHAQNVATLSHSGEETPFYGSEALVQALSSAVDGDIITLSDGTFTSCDIAKAVTIRGAGADIDNLWEPYAATVLSGTFRIMQPDSTAEKLTIEGIYHDDAIYYAGTLQGCTFSRCRLSSVLSEDGHLVDAQFIQCRIATYFQLNSNCSVTCMNCVLVDPHGESEETSYFNVANCVVLVNNDDIGFLRPGVVQNSILYDPADYHYVNGEVTEFYNNVAFVEGEFRTAVANTSNRVVSGLSAVFRTFTTGTYTDTETFELTSTAQKSYLGTDSTQVGIYGGSYPFVATASGDIEEEDSVLVATLIHSGEETPFYGSEALVQALSSAVDGDTITLSDGTFTSCDIAKAVTIRGAGADIDNLWEPYAATVLSGTFRIMQPDSTAEKLTIEGIYHDDAIIYTGTLQGCTFSRCRLSSVLRKDGHLVDAQFIQCRIATYFQLNDNCSVTCMNCVLVDPHGESEETSYFNVANCVVLVNNDDIGFLRPGVVQNSILYDPADYHYVNGEVTEFYNNVAFVEGEFRTAVANTSNRVVSSLSDVFRTFTTGTYTDTETFELTSTAQNSYLGTDSTQVGIYGGSYPFVATASGDIVLEEDTVLAEGQRFSDTPNLTINHANLTIKGEEGMTLNSVSMEASLPENSYAQVFSLSAQDISVLGDLSERIYTQGMTWNFLSLPFDCDLSRLEVEDGSAYAIRYYDGASRAANNVANGNWKNYGKRDIIPMGTGFIYMTEHDAWTRFYAVDNENKAHVFQSTSGETTLGLERHEATSAKNSGWNLVGNPYANYYSIQSMDFSKAVTVWNGASYDAVFPGDDDLALKPGQAFFVQCPSGVESITLPGSGRQLTAEVTGGAKARSASARDTRRLINLSLTDSQFTDKTRVVLNEEASMGYELEHDAGKFMSMRTEVPQLYSLGTDGTKYAINERPMDDGTVRLGLYIPQDGDYTLTITRNDAEQVLLTDSETGKTVDLTEGSYNFHSKKGTYNNRLMLTFGTVTGMDDVRWTMDDEQWSMYDERCTMYDGPCGEVYYDLSGRRIGKPTKTGTYLLKNGKRVQKLLVK